MHVVALSKNYFLTTAGLGCHLLHPFFLSLNKTSFQDFYFSL